MKGECHGWTEKSAMAEEQRGVTWLKKKEECHGWTERSAMAGITFYLLAKYLTLYHTITPFNDPIQEAFWNHHGKRRKCFVCLGFYVVSMVFKLFNSDSSQIHVSWTFFFNQYLTNPLSWYWQASCSTECQGKKLLPVLKILVCCGRRLNP